MYTGIGFSEIDTPNFSGSYYSFTKTYAESLLTSAYGSNTLILRLRMPVSDDLHPRSFVTKISQYERVVDIPNSNTVLHDLLPCSVVLALNNVVGVYNFTNPGAISHNEVLTLFERIVQPGFTWKNFSLEEQAKVIKAERSNCELDTRKLVNKMRQYRIEIPEVHAAYEQCFQRMADNMRVAGENARSRNRNMLASTSNTSVDPNAHPGQQNRDQGWEHTDGARDTAPAGAPQTVTATWMDS
jgi:3,5-epimerase/4-reductase